MPILVVPVHGAAALLMLRAGSFEYAVGSVPNIAEALGRTVLFTRSDQPGDVRLVARARLAGLTPRDRGLSIGAFENIRSIEPGVEMSGDASAASWVSTAEAARLLGRWRQILKPSPKPPGMGENEQADYETVDTSGIAQLVKDVRRAYDFHCALSHAKFSTIDRALEIVPLPAKEEAPLAISSMLPIARQFVPYFHRREITLDRDHMFLVDERRVPAEIVRQLRPGRDLYLPGNKLHRPSLDAIEALRRQFTGELP